MSIFDTVGRTVGQNLTQQIEEFGGAICLRLQSDGVKYDNKTIIISIYYYIFSIIEMSSNLSQLLIYCYYDKQFQKQSETASLGSKTHPKAPCRRAENNCQDDFALGNRLYRAEYQPDHRTRGIFQRKRRRVALRLNKP